MKNIYELSSQEKSNYRREFNKLNFAKDINVVRGPLLFITIFAFFASGILSGLSEDGLSFQSWVDLVDTIAVVSLGLFTILTFYLNITFTRWLKIKYNIEY